MKRSTTAALIGVGLTLFSVLAMAQEKREADEKLAIISSASAGCDAPGGGSPQSFSIFGHADAVLTQLSKLDVDLAKRKTYVLLVESQDKAEVFLHQRAGEAKVDAFRWSGKTAEKLRSDIERGILSNRGVNCVGEQTLELVRQSAKTDLKSDKAVDAPATVKAALSHTIQGLGKDFVRVTVLLLC